MRLKEELGALPLKLLFTLLLGPIFASGKAGLKCIYCKEGCDDSMKFDDATKANHSVPCGSFAEFKAFIQSEFKVTPHSASMSAPDWLEGEFFNNKTPSDLEMRAVCVKQTIKTVSKYPPGLIAPPDATNKSEHWDTENTDLKETFVSRFCGFQIVRKEGYIQDSSSTDVIGSKFSIKFDYCEDKDYCNTSSRLSLNIALFLPLLAMVSKWTY